MTVAGTSAFAASLQWDALPHAVRQRTRLALLDTVACIIGGSRLPAARAAAEAARGEGSAMAACALGIAASALDFDDGHYEAGGIHLSSVVLPALIASLPAGITMEELLAALATGLEIGIRAGYLMAPRAPGDPYHTSGAAASIGAAAATARLIGLDADGIARALRIASAQAPMARLQLPMVKESIGWGAASALGAARLAAAGFARTTSPSQLSEAPLGIAPTPFEEARGEDAFARDLGARWRLLDLYVKPYPCCRAIHAAIDGVLAAITERQWSPGEIEAITVRVPAGSEALDFLPPASIEHAQFSFPWVLGCLLAHGAITAAHFRDDLLQDTTILRAAARITLVGDPALQALSPAHSYPAHVTVHARGAVEERLVRHAPGSAARPLSPEQIAGKFRACVAPVLGEAGSNTLLAALDSPDEALAPAALRTLLFQTMEFRT